MQKIIVAQVVNIISTQTITKFIETEVIHCFGASRRPILDRHPAHCSRELKNLAQMYDFELQYAPAYSQILTGLSESAIRSLQQTLKFVIQDDMSSWPDTLSESLFAINLSMQTNMRQNAHYLLMGYLITHVYLLIVSSGYVPIFRYLENNE